MSKLLLGKLLVAFIIENLIFYYLLKWKKRKKVKPRKTVEDHLTDLKEQFGEVFIKIT